jgi:tRNA pseudouridine38-40 synthase
MRPERSWVLGANSNLPDSISVLWARPVSELFNARHSALARSYRYVILNRMSRPAVLRGRVGWMRHELDAPRMHRAAQHLLGEHDFTSFRAAQCQSPTPMRRLQFIRVTRQHDFVTVDVMANAFLHHMVRNIVGVLLAVGRDQVPEDWPATVLAARDRRAAGMTAAADGLYLYGVHYPAEFGLPAYREDMNWPPGPTWPAGELPPRPAAFIPADTPAEIDVEPPGSTEGG